MVNLAIKGAICKHIERFLNKMETWFRGFYLLAYRETINLFVWEESLMRYYCTMGKSKFGLSNLSFYSLHFMSVVRDKPFQTDKQTDRQTNTHTVCYTDKEKDSQKVCPDR